MLGVRQVCSNPYVASRSMKNSKVVFPYSLDSQLSSSQYPHEPLATITIGIFQQLLRRYLAIDAGAQAHQYRSD
jgi:hypothetical protein